MEVSDAISTILSACFTPYERYKCTNKIWQTKIGCVFDFPLINGSIKQLNLQLIVGTLYTKWWIFVLLIYCIYIKWDNANLNHVNQYHIKYMA